MAQRFQNRLELRMVVMDLPGLRMIGPGQYKSMGTGGLKAEEVRALTHRLSVEQELLNSSADAQRMLAMLERKVETLPTAELALEHYQLLSTIAGLAPSSKQTGGADGKAAAAPRRRAPPPARSAPPRPAVGCDGAA